MNLFQAGTGEPIIFIHGLVGNHRVFREQLSYFSEKYQVVAYDYIGHGENHTPIPFTLDNLVEELNRIYKVAGIEKAHLCSLSFGTYIASSFASYYPDKVLSLCNIGGYYNSPSPLLDAFQLVWENRDLEYRAFVELFANTVFPSGSNAPESLNIIARKVFVNNAIKTDPNILIETVRLMLDYEIPNLLKKIDHPFLWVVGEYDYLFKTCLNDLYNLLPQVRFVDLPRSGHVAHVYQPELFQEIYEGFLTNIPVRQLNLNT